MPYQIDRFETDQLPEAIQERHLVQDQTEATWLASQSTAGVAPNVFTGNIHPPTYEFRLVGWGRFNAVI